MGLFKKIFKPVAKVLDKVIPNEIKPALPYLAAFAPVFAPAGIQGLLGQTMMRRALTSGGLNILGQLSQEGSEGDINLLSAGLGALTGAMTTPATPGTAVGPAGQYGTVGAKPGAAEIFRTKAEAIGTDTLRGKGLGFLAEGSEMFAAGAKDPFSMAGAKAATLPAATATGDVMQAQARQLEKQAAIDAALAEAEALADSGMRGDAIRNAMRAYGFFTDDEIESTVSSAGYRGGGRVGFDKGGAYMDVPYSLFVKAERAVENEEINPRTGDPYDNVDQYIEAYLKGYKEEDFKYKTGGRVGFKFGGIDAAIDKVEDESIKESVKMVADMPDMDLMDLIEEFEITFKRKPMSMEELKQFYRENYEMESPVKMKEKIREKITVEAKDGGRIGFKSGTGKILGLPAEEFQLEGDQGDQLDLALQMFLRDNEDNELLKVMLDTAEERGTSKLQVLMDLMKNQKVLDAIAKEDGEIAIDKISVKDLARKEGSMKDGGLMDLGGKEMDLRKGGFVPIGKKERADDVPARLSKNEFVMTADAVRGAGGGDINKGAKRMYETMNNLEARA